MRLRPTQYIAISQLALGLSIIICMVIVPHYFFTFNQGGLSNYGTEPQTRALFTFGFALVTVGTLLAALHLPQRTRKRRKLRLCLLVLAALYLVLLLSTFSYKNSASSGHSHRQVAFVLFIAMLAIAIWLRFVANSKLVAKRLFVIFVIGIVAAGLTSLGVLHILFTAQLISAISFGMLLYGGVKELTSS